VLVPVLVPVLTAAVLAEEGDITASRQQHHRHQQRRGRRLRNKDEVESGDNPRPTTIAVATTTTVITTPTTLAALEAAYLPWQAAPSVPSPDPPVPPAPPPPLWTYRAPPAHGIERNPTPEAESAYFPIEITTAERTTLVKPHPTPREVCPGVVATASGL